jgi:uncharacterized protein YifE (UPF0438 family)
MLTTQEAARLKQLIEGHRMPDDGMEKHFLRVIRGEAMPCSSKEQEWYQHWRQANGNLIESEDYRRKYEEATARLREREETIRILEERIAGFERESKRLGEVLQRKDQSIEALTKEIVHLKEWLKNAHEALNKYEPIEKIREPQRLTDESEKWRTCQACGRQIDFCQCGN